MKEAHVKGSPVIRPLFYEFPNDSVVWENSKQYMFGSKMMVVPIMEDGQRETKVYFPEGTEWVNAWTKDTYDGEPGTMCWPLSIGFPFSFAEKVS